MAKAKDELDDDTEDLDEEEDEDEEEGEDEDEEEEEDVENEFDDEFEDEFADAEEEGDDLASFGPIYVQAESSRGFELIAVVCSVLVTGLALYLLYTRVFTEVYDGITKESLSAYDGVGRRKTQNKDDGPEQIAYAPSAVRILGFGRYDLNKDSEEYDYAILDAGADHGLGVGMIYELRDPKAAKDAAPIKTLVITKVERMNSRADFVKINEPDSNQISRRKAYTDADELISHKPGIPMRDQLDVYNKLKEQVIDGKNVADPYWPMPPPVSPLLRESLVWEAIDFKADSAKNYSKWNRVDPNPEWKLLVPDTINRSDADTLVPDPRFVEVNSTKKDGKSVYGYLEFGVTPTAYLAQKQVLISQIIDLNAKVADEEKRQ